MAAHETYDWPDPPCHFEGNRPLIQLVKGVLQKCSPDMRIRPKTIMVWADINDRHVFEFGFEFEGDFSSQDIERITSELGTTEWEWSYSLERAGSWEPDTTVFELTFRNCPVPRSLR